MAVATYLAAVNFMNCPLLYTTISDGCRLEGLQCPHGNQYLAIARRELISAGYPTQA